MELSPEVIQLIEAVGIPGFIIIIVLIMFRRQSTALAKQSEITAQRAAKMDEERAKDKEELDKQLERAHAQNERSTSLAVGILRDEIARLDKRVELLSSQRDKLQLEVENGKRRIDEIESKLSQSLNEIKVKDKRIAQIETAERKATEALKTERQAWELRERELLEKIRELELQITALTARVVGLEAADGIKTDKLKKIETGLLVDPAVKDQAA